MTDTLTTRVYALTDQQALHACEALASALELDLPRAKLDTSDFGALLAAGSPAEKRLHAELEAVRPSVAATAEAARSMLLLAADLGYTTRVDTAVTAARAHARDFGILSGPLLLAGLAVVLAYVPVEQRRKVTEIRTRGADGAERVEKVEEDETKRVGAAAVEKLASWWKAMLQG